MKVYVTKEKFEQIKRERKIKGLPLIENGIGSMQFNLQHNLIDSYVEVDIDYVEESDLPPLLYIYTKKEELQLWKSLFPKSREIKSFSGPEWESFEGKRKVPDPQRIFHVSFMKASHGFKFPELSSILMSSRTINRPVVLNQIKNRVYRFNAAGEKTSRATLALFLDEDLSKVAMMGRGKTYKEIYQLVRFWSHLLSDLKED